MTAAVDALLRELAPRVLATLARGHEGFDRCEDAVQEALLAAATQWPVEGVPDNPAGWLVRVASRRWIEGRRQDDARRRREDAVAVADPTGDVVAPSARDDSLTLLTLCCHPALTQPAQVALTLRAVGGLTTGEIARALLVPEATVGQRISRAKARIRASGLGFAPPSADERDARVAAVLRVLYLVFTEGHTASSGASLHRVDLAREAIRLTRMLRAEVPEDGEVAGLLALMLLTDARRAARTDALGRLVPLAAQDRNRWDHDQIAEGVSLLEATLPVATIGPYQLQAAIAAVHAEARTAADTDWREILGLYGHLAAVAPGPMVTLSHVVALAAVDGPTIGLQALAAATAADPVLARHHRVDAVRAHLLAESGDAAAARAAYTRAAAATSNLAERDHLLTRARDLG
ncbi:RNA polymerase sigma factor [Jatrophihabitans sp. YIM 134969]